MNMLDLSGVDVADRIRDGVTTSRDVVRACTDRIEQSDPDIRAWAWFDAGQAAEQARSMDELRRHGQPTGSLHGVPVGIKDIIDVAGMPTGLGTTFHNDRMPAADAALVEKLREAGAVILGKTSTTEYAYMQPAATRNPHDRTRTPGGSSSGSAAAVAAGQVPLAVGTQTNGSVIRPAAYCGVYGFKPSRGIISRRGVLQTSEHLDQVGVFGRSLHDVARLADVLAGYDAADPASYLRPRPRMQQGYLADAPVEPSFAWLDLPFDDRLSQASRDGFDELLDALDGRVERLPAPESFRSVLDCHKVIHDCELYQNLRGDIERYSDHVSAAVLDAARRAQGYPQGRLADALAMLAGAEDYFQQFFFDYDAIIAPATAGEAPALEDGTGDPVFCTVWTFAGLPCLSLPLLLGESGLPVGVQLIGAANADDRLLRTAAWLLRRLEAEDPDDG